VPAIGATYQRPGKPEAGGHPGTHRTNELSNGIMAILLTTLDM
jgi:hypothetical protein